MGIAQNRSEDGIHIPLDEGNSKEESTLILYPTVLCLINILPSIYYYVAVINPYVLFVGRN